jgi:hypothetical protein
MSEIITEQSVKMIYSMLRKLPPFDSWKLPPASKIKFKVDPNFKFMGELDVKPYKMTFGTKHQEHFLSIVTTVAHEMVHLHLYLEGVASYNQHRRIFRQKSAEIGSLYGFDRKTL